MSSRQGWLLLMLVGFGLNGWANQSITVNGTTKNFTVPNSAPYVGLGSFHVDLRVHSWSVSGSCQTIAGVPGFPIQICPGNSVQTSNYVDTIQPGQNGYVAANVTGKADFLLRIQRDVANKRMTAEVWNIDGTGYAQDVTLLATVNPLTFPQVGVVGDANARIAFLRWYTGLVPLGTRLELAPPPGAAPGGNLGDWEFEGNDDDSSGHRLNLSGGQSYSASPTYAPACLAGSQKSFRAGAPGTLDASMSYPLDGGTQLSYLWQQEAGVSPVEVLWDSRTAAKPVIQGMVFGPYNFRLQVTDGSGASSTCMVHHGAVATDNNGVVLTGDAKLDQLLGPMIQWGRNPWLYADDRHKYLADHFGGLQSTVWDDVWEDTFAGTIALTQGSTTITGSGTSFLTTFACNGSDFIDVRWTHTPPGGSPTQYRWGANVISCASNTQMTVTFGTSPGVPWAYPTESGRAYSKITFADIGNLYGQSTNMNYYDNVVAFYSLYYRSGIDTYRNYARTLADRWWLSFGINQGFNCDPQGGQLPCVAPRIRAMMGLWLRALDGRPDMFPGLREWANFSISSTTLAVLYTPFIYDLREYSYTANEVAMDALLDPDAGQRATARAALVNVVNNVYAAKERCTNGNAPPCDGTGGYWVNGSNGLATWNGATGTVNVTNGSTTVVGSGTNFTAGCNTDADFWSKTGSGAPVSNAEGDAVWYSITAVTDATHLEISPAYQGATAGGRGWQCNNLVGIGVQPFMQGGVAGRTLHNISKALTGFNPTEAAKAQALLVDNWNWMVHKAYNATSKNIYYGVVFPNCEPSPIANANCSSIGDGGIASGFILQAGRFTAAEVMDGCGRAYLVSRQPDIKAACDNLYGGIYGGMGGPSSDNDYVWDLLGRWNQPGFTVTASVAKNFGFTFGFGGGSAWPGASAGGAAPVNNQAALVGFDFGEVAQATVYRVRVTAPTGAQNITSCTDSPCNLTIDVRLGDHLYEADYLSSGEAVRARRDPDTLPAR